LISEELNELELIEESVGLSGNQMIKKVGLLKENLQLLEQEEAYWHNRSHEHIAGREDVAGREGFARAHRSYTTRVKSNGRLLPEAKTSS
jgi:hypothetical protein